MIKTIKSFHLSSLLLAASIIASLAGVAVFFLLFLPDFNVYWLIVSPIIFTLYQAPAALLYRLYKKEREKEKKNAPDGI